MHMKKLRASDWLKTKSFSCEPSAKLLHKCKVVTRVQITKSVQMLSKLRLS